MVKALSNMPRLKSPHALNNEQTPESASKLTMSKLQQLDLSYCGINDTVCVSLVISLSKHCPLLEVLNFGYKGRIMSVVTIII